MISDGNGVPVNGHVHVIVNGPPTANADTATVAEDQAARIDVLANDVDDQSLGFLRVTSVTQGLHGAVAINADKTVSYTPVLNYNGTDSLTYTITDGYNLTSTATVTITVTPVNDAPVAVADTAAVAEDGFVDAAVLGNESDPDGDTLTVTSVTQGAHGAAVIHPDGTVRYTPAADYNGSDSFTYTISDGNGGTAMATVTVAVAAVDDAPVAVNDSAAVTAGGAATISVLANDTDIDGPSLSVTSVTQGAHGTVAINGGQTVTYTAGLYIGVDSFTYTVSDGAGGTATATVTVNVTMPARVATGLQVRYDFNEGSGDTIQDTSGAGAPLNLTVKSTSAVNWLSGGLAVNSKTTIASAGPATKIIDAAQSSNAITVEAWLLPSSLTLNGPAGILRLAKNHAQRNLVFGQSGGRYETEIRTSSGRPSLQSPAGSLSLELAHVVYTRSNSGEAVYYINGILVSSQTAGGDLSAWGSDQKLSLADDWQGTYFLMAVYGRALTSAEVQQNFLAGANGN
ncbi:MAG TPA: Ig-like domain-containing protein [Thermoanaerobaculia bacterium]|nr:Ig-like domain-containing protein [Thermoanaerobaculia bacterium]